MKIQLSDIAQFVADRVSSSKILLQEYVTTDSILPDKQGRTMAQNMPPQTCSLTKFEKGDVLVSNIRPYLRKIWLADMAGGASAYVLVFRAKKNSSSQYLYAVLAQDVFYDWVMLGTKGSRMPRGNREQIMRFPILELCEQETLHIGTLIENISNKINLNRQINQNLSVQQCVGLGRAIARYGSTCITRLPDRSSATATTRYVA